MTMWFNLFMWWCILLDVVRHPSLSSSCLVLASTEVNADDNDKSSGLLNDENRDKANAIGAEVRERLREFRGGSTEFYQRLLKSILVIVCDNKVKMIREVGDAESRNPAIRFVPSDDPAAYKDDTGTCVRVNKPEDAVAKAYADGRCEVRPNCYWADLDVENGSDYRYPTYALAESKYGRLRDGDVTLAQAEAELLVWVQGLAILVAPGIVLAVLTLLTLVLFLFCRCCCNKCGGRNPNPNGYRLSKKLVPLLVHVIACAAIVAMLAMSQLYNNEVMSSISRVFDITEATLDESTTWIKSARQPLMDVRDQVFATVASVKVELEGTDFIEVGLGGITSRVEAFGATTANVSMPRGCRTDAQAVFCYPCAICETIDDQVRVSNDQMKLVAEAGIDQVKSSRATINGELVVIQDDIHRMVSDKVNQTEAVLTSLSDARETVSELSDTYGNQDEARRVGFSGLFALFLVIIALSLVGIVFGLSPCKIFVNVLHLAYLLGFVTLLFGFLLSSLMLALSVFLGDVCELTLLMQQDWTPYIGVSASRGINACFQNQSLLEAYNLTDTLDFQDMIEFPEQDFSMDFGDFEAFRDDIQGTDDSTFEMDDTLLTTYIAGMNNFTGLEIDLLGMVCRPGDRNYSLADIMWPWRANGDPAPLDDGTTREQYMTTRYSNLGPRAADVANCDAQVSPEMCSRGQDPCGYKDVVLEFYTNITTLVTIKTDSKDFIAGMTSNMTGLDNYIQTFTQNVTRLQTNLDIIQDDLVSSLFVHVDAFKAGMYCEFVADRFNEMLDEMCANLLPAFLMISLCLLLASVFLIPITICNIVLCKRLKAPGDGSEMPEENEFK